MEKDGGFKMGFQDRSKMASRHLLPRHTAAKNKSLRRGNGNSDKWGKIMMRMGKKMGLGNSNPTTCFPDLQLQRSRV